MAQVSVPQIARHAGATLSATLLVQLSTFLVLASAPLFMPSAAFAKLTVLVALTMTSSALFDLGLSVTATKFYSKELDIGYLVVVQQIRDCLALLAIVAAVVVALLGQREIALGIVLGAILNCWNGTRNDDLAQQNYNRFFGYSALTAALRLTFGGVGIALHNPWLICIGILGVAPALAIMTSRRPRAGGLHTANIIRTIAPYASHMYLAGLSFAATGYLTQIVVANRLSPTDVGTLGLTVTFTAPVTLIVYSLRNVLLPKLMQSPSLTAALWSYKGALVVAMAWVALCGTGCAAALVLDRVYGLQYPDLLATFLLYFISVASMSCLGIFSLSVHTLDAPGVNTLGNLVRLITLVVGLAVWANTLFEATLLCSLSLLTGEIIIVLALTARNKTAA